jgi:hypothetical protein
MAEAELHLHRGRSSRPWPARREQSGQPETTVTPT